MLIPLPALDFDPTEVAVSWEVLRGLGHAVEFATPDGAPARPDDLVGVGRVLRADTRARLALAGMVQSPEFARPSPWEAIDVAAVDGLVLPGGHRARGMRPYLESTSSRPRWPRPSTVTCRWGLSATAYCWPPGVRIRGRAGRCSTVTAPPR